MNEYSSLASIYDIFTEDIDFVRYAARYGELLKSNGVPDGGFICDIACGTGKLSVRLALAGYDLICVDSSPDMLSRAAARFSEAGVSPLLLCQDMVELDLYGTVNAFICTIDGLNHVLNADDLLEVFKRAALFLEPPGIFIFDLNTVKKHEITIGDGDFVYEDEGVFAVRASRYDPATHITTAKMDIFTRIDGGLWTRSYDEVAERAYPEKELLPILTEAGFEPLASYDDLNDAPANENSERVIRVCRKRP